VAKHRLFVWLDIVAVPDSRLTVVARDDDVCFGILHSRFHEAWSLVTCSWHGVGNDPTYNAESCFDTFPFPIGLTPNIPPHEYAVDPRGISIAEAARELCRLREYWLNPPDLVRREPEVVPGFPERLVPVNAAAAATLKKRTLTNLYNERPAWLSMRIAISTPPSPPPMAGRPISPRTMRSRGCLN
jgi:type II restriction/modification system DNA methylase subunit YeeA